MKIGVSFRMLLFAGLGLVGIVGCETIKIVDVSSPTGTITGTVSAEGWALDGVFVALVGGPASMAVSTTTYINGAYTFTSVQAGSYGITIDASNHPDVSFAVTSKSTAIVADGQQSTVDFSGTYVRTASIVGLVSASGQPLAGVSVRVTGGPENVTRTSVTGGGGGYSVTDLRRGVYTVALVGTLPAGISFNDTTQTVTVVTGESKIVNFVGTSAATVLGVGFGPEQFALIPAGTFVMGDDGSTRDNEKPAHTVNITKAFYLQKTEVTQGQWRQVMGSNSSYFSSCGDTCPVEQVSWDDIQQFLSALNAQDPGKNYRLPTEAEWEYACRAGTTGDYGGTGVPDQMGWYKDNSGGETHPVAQKQPNHWGLFDMHGNVFEWVQDWYSSTYYSVSPTNDPQGPVTGTSRVLRGGSWGSNAGSARSAHRGYSLPGYRGSVIGFRLARTQ